MAEQAGGEHFRVVDDHHVSGREQLRQLGNAGVEQGAAHAVQSQQLRAFAVRNGLLSDQFERKRKVEVRNLHGLMLAKLNH